jgi:probable phosphoglycerate mutase
MNSIAPDQACQSAGVSWPFERIALVRHGETEWNREGRRQGQLDSPLTADGRRHGEQMASVLSATAVDAIFSSPLGRAQHTARIIAGRIGLPVQVVDDLAEVHHGRFAGLTNADVDRIHPGELQRRATQRFTWRYPDGESYSDADPRAAAALGQIAATGSTLPLIVTHEMFGRLLLRVLLDLSPADALAHDLPHGAVFEIAPPSRTLRRCDGGPGNAR